MTVCDGLISKNLNPCSWCLLLGKKELYVKAIGYNSLYLGRTRQIAGNAGLRDLLLGNRPRLVGRHGDTSTVVHAVSQTGGRFLLSECAKY